mmetsp:Transcript_17837/g.34869  ORF Transcript_17837/g.34869 Transcript_17837/m.34869 type:complete len:614 (+) Transcript_17837:244-2085(+)
MGSKAALESLRVWMASEGLAAIIVTSDDAHQSEYVAECDSRRAFVSDFDGSAGTAVVLQDSAYLWTDGRYVLQASKQCDQSMWKVMQTMPKGGNTMPEHLAEILPPNSKVGIDPFLVPVNTARTLETKLTAKGHELVALAKNPVDAIWSDRPAAPDGKVIIQPTERAGVSVKDKLSNLRQDIKKQGAQAQVVAALDEVAWLLNVRGCDVTFNPVVISYVIITMDQATWYVDESKLGDEVREHVAASNVSIKPYGDFSSDLAAVCTRVPSVLVDPARSSWAISRIIASHSSICSLIEKLSPVCEAKSIKNPTEIAGIKEAHLKDAVALAKFYSWLETAMAAGEDLTEVSVADELEGLRREQDGFMGLSFETISSYGANGAIIHYKPSPGSCAKLGTDSLFLCDSGGQYRDGTTDVTRTFCFGTPTDHHKQCYTMVLKGHIALSSVVFPCGTTGHTLDILARTPLWTSGLDYRHGTGHGVGAFLNVHEGPHLISYYPRDSDPPIKEGMTSSVEPGYYEEGNFGIRIENVAIVVKAKTPFNFGGLDYLTFEPVTMTPLSAKLIDISMLSSDEVNWVDDYHSRVWERVSPRVEGKTREWLRANTLPLVTQVLGEDVG